MTLKTLPPLWAGVFFWPCRTVPVPRPLWNFFFTTRHGSGLACTRPPTVMGRPYPYTAPRVAALPFTKSRTVCVPKQPVRRGLNRTLQGLAPPFAQQNMFAFVWTLLDCHASHVGEESIPYHTMTWWWTKVTDEGNSESYIDTCNLR